MQDKVADSGTLTVCVLVTRDRYSGRSCNRVCHLMQDLMMGPGQGPTQRSHIQHHPRTGRHPTNSSKSSLCNLSSGLDAPGRGFSLMKGHCMGL